MSYRRAALEKWKQYNGPRATYRKLIAAFEQAGHKDFTGVVKKWLVSITIVSSTYYALSLYIFHISYMYLRLAALMCLLSICLILGALMCLLFV